MAEEEHLERERAGAREAERVVVPEEWARILELARARWPELDTRGVYTWDGLAERLAGQLDLPPDEIQREIAGFRDGLSAEVTEIAISNISGGMIHVVQLPGEVGTDDEWD